MHRCEDRSSPSVAVCLVVALAAALLCRPAGAQPADPAEAARAADAAQADLEAARRELEAATARLEQAREKADLAEAVAVEAEKAAAEVARDPAVEAARAAEERAIRAELTALDARQLALRLEHEMRELREQFAFDRTGFYIGAGVFFAPEDFRNGIRADDSKGLYGRLGYRVHSHVAIEVRLDWADEFDAQSDFARGDVEAYAITGNVRLFILTSRLQPYVGLGFGAIHMDVKGTRFADGSEFDRGKTEGVFRPSAGVDLYLTPYVLLNLDAAYLAPGGDLGDFSFSTLGGGLELRF